MVWKFQDAAANPLLMVWNLQEITVNHLHTFTTKYLWFWKLQEAAVNPLLMVWNFEEVAVKPFANFTLKY